MVRIRKVSRFPIHRKLLKPFSVKYGREAMKKVADHYFQNIVYNNRSEVRKTLIQIYTDVSFNVGAEQLTRTLSQNGVSHADDLQYLFASTLGKLKGDDKEVSEIFLDLWTDFARTHDPTPGNDLPFKWLQTEPSSPKYLNINLHPKMVNKKLTENVEFWDVVLGKTTLDPSI